MEQINIQALRRMYLENRITPEEVMDHIIEQAKTYKEYHIWIVEPQKEKMLPYLKALKEKDMQTAPLWGIPFAIKDNIDLAGFETTAGCPAYAYSAREDAVVVQRLIAAGAIPVGKTNLDQFATGLVGTRSPYGETHNGLREELISGGSSSGSAVAVATGLAAFSLGTDTAGSGRVPAALNRLVGLKTAVGAWPTKGLVPACASLDCITVFANNIEDAYLVDSIVRGEEKDDPWSKRTEIPIAQLPQKILIPKEEPEFYGTFESQYRQAWKKTIEHMKRLDIPVVEIEYSFFSKAAKLLYEGPCVAERWAALGEFVLEHEKEVFPVTREILKSPLEKKYTATDVYVTQHKLQEYKKKAWNVLKDAVLVMPTCGGTFTRKQVDADPIGTNSKMGLYTNHCNLLDLSAIAIPATDIEKDLPFGITAFATANEEGLLKGFSEKFIEKRTIPIAVCGLHMRNMPLEGQMRDLEAFFEREAYTKDNYHMYKLLTQPEKPGLVQEKEGKSIHLEIWQMPLENIGKFVTMIPKPLGIGTIELQDGTFVNGFIYDKDPAIPSVDITQFGGWKEAMK